MRWPGVATAAALLTATLVAPPAPASAADTCFGLAPTIVGTPGQPLTGTPGPDVVITNGAIPVSTLEGDDTVCMTNRSPDVETGAGADRVDATAIPFGVSADLGGGSDTFGGSSAGDFVRAGDEADARASVPWGVDTIDTGAGPDAVVTGTTIEPVQPNGDAIHLGGGMDGATVRGTVPTTLDGGAGPDELVAESEVRGDWVVDARTGVIALDGAAMPAVTSFSAWVLIGLSWDSLVFRGTDADEVVDVTRGNGVVKDGPFSARLGGGDDELFVRSRDTGPFNGGAGNDSVFVEAKGTTSGNKIFAADLGTDGYVVSGRDPVVAKAIENLSVYNADGAIVFGDAAANQLAAYGCGTEVHGRDGDDRIDGGATKGCYDGDATPGLTAYGDRGDDVLRGGPSRDVLIGGPGRDEADGWYGRDRCMAETRTRCER